MAPVCGRKREVGVRLKASVCRGWLRMSVDCRGETRHATLVNAEVWCFVGSSESSARVNLSVRAGAVESRRKRECRRLGESVAVRARWRAVVDLKCRQGIGTTGQFEGGWEGRSESEKASAARRRAGESADIGAVAMAGRRAVAQVRVKERERA
eukprot:6172025-Pleurochrysis_carterae.AAC.7